MDNIGKGLGVLGGLVHSTFFPQKSSSTKTDEKVSDVATSVIEENCSTSLVEKKEAPIMNVVSPVKNSETKQEENDLSQNSQTVFSKVIVEKIDEFEEIDANRISGPPIVTKKNHNNSNILVVDVEDATINFGNPGEEDLIGKVVVEEELDLDRSSMANKQRSSTPPSFIDSTAVTSSNTNQSNTDS